MRSSLTRIRDRVRRETDPAPEQAPAAPGGPAGRAAPGRTFVLGLGAQKAGTSWLYEYLAASPQYAAGYKKEFHVFDTIDFDAERRAQELRRAEVHLDRALAGKGYKAGPLHWAAMVGNTDMYFDYFTGLLASRRRFRLTGDFTPAYAALSRERVAGIKEQFDRRRVRTVAVFSMRDPVERIWSAARMLDRKFPDMWDLPPEDVVARFHGDETFALRSGYDHTLAVMDEVFAPEDRFTCFYEELFDPATVARLCDVLGVDYREPDLGAVHNPSPKGEASLPDDVVRRVAEHYRPVYEAVAARYPGTDLRSLWPSSRFVL